MSAPTGGSRDVVLFDGLCPLCHGAVRFLAKRDRAGRLAFAPLAGATASRLLAEAPDEVRKADSVVLVERDGRVSVRSTALLRAARALGPGWRALAVVARIMPRFMRDALYDAVARRRARWWGRYDACPAPPPVWAGRFLE
ncbi:MAG TPA: DCC1-like thiol-disulfide oxidoreductase family protein [Candidatus Thermoplasmatota archaeon]|nr:DCC1-like thiol-disulfide oxidoreductase family protein [Candidatus Thermoplasmatota archaeon]